MLKPIKIIEDPEQEEITIVINRDKVVQVRPVGEEETEIILEGNTTLRTKLSFKETLKKLS